MCYAVLLQNDKNMNIYMPIEHSTHFADNIKPIYGLLPDSYNILRDEDLKTCIEDLNSFLIKMNMSDSIIIIEKELVNNNQKIGYLFNSGLSVHRFIIKDPITGSEEPINTTMKFPSHILDQARKLSLQKKIKNFYIDLKVAPDSQYSCLQPFQIYPVRKIMKLWFPNGENIKHVADANANIGCDTINFTMMFVNAEIDAIEINPNVSALLKSNIKKLKLASSVNIITGDSVQILNESEKKYDIIYFDPPWGGKNYRNEKKMMLHLNNIPIYTIINNLMDEGKARNIVLKVPNNFDISEFVKFIKYPFNNKSVVVGGKQKFKLLLIRFGSKNKKQTHFVKGRGQLKEGSEIAVPYDYDEVNRAIIRYSASATSATSSESAASAASAIPHIEKNTKLSYKQHLVDLFRVEFAASISTDRNEKVRKLLIDNINNTIFSEPCGIINYFDQLHAILEDFPEDEAKLIEVSNEIIINIAIAGKCITIKNNLIDSINNNVFNFDRIIIKNLQDAYSTSPMSARKMLNAHMEKLVVFSEGKGIENIYMACSGKINNQSHCKGEKLMIPKEDYDKLLDIIIADIMNPLTGSKIITSRSGVVNLNSFIRRDGETISMVEKK